MIFIFIGVVVLLACVAFTTAGQDWLTRLFAKGVAPVAGIRGEGLSADEVRRLRPYLVQTPTAPSGELWLAHDQTAAQPPASDVDGIAGMVSCVLTPYRILPASNGLQLAFLPRWLAFLGGPPCEHGPEGHAPQKDGPDPANLPMTDLERAIAGQSSTLQDELLRGAVWAVDFALEMNAGNSPRLRIKTVENSEGVRFVPVFTNDFFAQMGFPGEPVRKVPLTVLAKVLGQTTVVINPAMPFQHVLGPEELEKLRQVAAASAQVGQGSPEGVSEKNGQ